MTTARAIVLALAALAAQVPQTQAPARDAARPPVGTSTVSGVVVTADTPARPLRRVRVALQSADLRAPVAVMTDDDGRFVLAGVASGNYTVMASRPGYVDTILGAAAGGILGAPVSVVDGQDVTGLSITLPRGAVITGMVRYPSGRPAPGIQLQISPVKTVDGKRRVRFTAGLSVATTDDRGIYRHFGLASGDYLVQMSASGMDPAGPAQEQRQTTQDEAAWADRTARSSATTATGAPPPGRIVTPAPIYYPGTTDIALARVITVGPGEERDGIDLTVEYALTAQLAGRVFDLDGQPRRGVNVRLTGKMGSSIADLVGAMFGRGGRTDDDGAYTIDAVPPGEYTLTVQAPSVAEAAAKPATPEQPNLMTMVSGMFGGGAAGSLHASEQVVVAGQDLANIDLRLRPGVVVSGTVVYEGAAARPSGSAQVLLVAGMSSGSAVELAMSMLQGVSGRVAPDLSFSVSGVAPGRYRASVNLPGMMFGQALPNAVWSLKSIRGADGADLADALFEVAPGRDVSGVVVTLTDKPTVLSGKVFDRTGRPSSAFPIIVFSTNPAHWLAGSRRVQQVRPSNDGAYRLAGLPAGEYYIGAVTTLDIEDLFDPLFLQQIVPIAFRITLSEGETRTQDLKLGGG